MDYIFNILSFLCLSTICFSYKIGKSNTGLKIEKTNVVEEGCGGGAKNGSLIVVHYTGAFVNETTFDSSYDRNEPLKLIFNECPPTLIPG